MQANRKKALLILLVVLGLVSIVSVPLAGKNNPSQNKVAVVNRSVITRAEFDRSLAGAQQQYSRMGKPLSDSKLSEIKKTVLEKLIDRELLYQESQKEGIKINKAAVDDQLNKLKGRFPGEAEFKKQLRKMNLSEAALKSQFRRNMTIQRFIDEKFAPKVDVSDKEIKDYYNSHIGFFKQRERVKASHILIKVDPEADDSEKAEARKKLDGIRQKLKGGEDFAALARKSSQCPSSAKGGDLGYFGPGKMVQPFEKAAFALAPGKVSEIVETRFGYHLIKVTDRKPASTIPYQDAKGNIEQHLKRERVHKEVSSYVSELREKAKVERFLKEAQ